METASPERLALAAKIKQAREAHPKQSWAKIAATFGISRSYASELYYDPDGTEARARKLSYRKPCPDCGKPMGGSGGPNHPPAHCANCAPKHATVWTHDTVIAAFQTFHHRQGRTPTAVDVVGKWPSVAAKLTPERLAEIPADHGLPSHGVVKELFGSWQAAQQAAGLPTSINGGTPGHRTVRRDIQRRDHQILEAIRNGAHTRNMVAAVTGRDPGAIGNRLRVLTERGTLTRTLSREWGHPYIYEIADQPRS